MRISDWSSDVCSSDLRVALLRIGHMVDTLVEQLLQDDALVVGRAADQEVVGGVAPGLLQPGDVGLKAAGGEDDAARREIERLPAETGGDADAGPVLQVNPFHLRLVVGHDTEALAMAVERIHQGTVAAEEEGVGAPQVPRSEEQTSQLQSL